MPSTACEKLSNVVQNAIRHTPTTAHFAGTANGKRHQTCHKTYESPANGRTKKRNIHIVVNNLRWARRPETRHKSNENIRKHNRMGCKTSKNDNKTSIFYTSKGKTPCRTPTANAARKLTDLHENAMLQPLKKCYFDRKTDKTH